MRNMTIMTTFPEYPTDKMIVVMSKKKIYIYFKRNKFVNEFKSGILGFYFI